MTRPAVPILATLAVLAASMAPGPIVRALRDDGPNALDHDRIERGYYERLTGSWRDPASIRRPAGPFDAGALAEPVDDVREYILKPNLTTTHKGARWTTNALGLRDRDYPATKPAGSIRIALVGDSIAAGWGVDDGLGFEPSLERTWDARSIASGGPRVEVLNFAVPGHAPGQRWEHFGRTGRGTSPDLVLFAGTLADLGWDERRLRVLIPKGLGPEAPAYREALAAIGTDRPLRPHREAILAGVYRRVVADCRARGVAVAWLLLPRVGRHAERADRDRIDALARSAGFDLRVDLSDAFDGRASSDLAIGPDDFHPNAAGHAALADRLDFALAGLVSATAAGSRPPLDPLDQRRPPAAGADPR